MCFRSWAGAASAMTCAKRRLRAFLGAHPIVNPFRIDRHTASASTTSILVASKQQEKAGWLNHFVPTRSTKLESSLASVSRRCEPTSGDTRSIGSHQEVGNGSSPTRTFESYGRRFQVPNLCAFSIRDAGLSGTAMQ